MSTTPSWDLFGSFLAVMREGSLSAAARALAIAQPTVRRHIEALEAALPAVLFTRSPTGLMPTDVARRLLPHAEAMAVLAQALVRDARAEDGPGPAGTVRIGCSEILAREVIAHLLAPLLAQCPRLEIEISASNRQENLMRRDVDIAVRMVRPTQVALVARKTGTIAIGLYASRAYLARHEMPRSPADLAQGHVLVGDDDGARLASALAGLGVPIDSLRFAFRSNDDGAQLSALRAGIGIGVCQVPLGDRDPDLTRVLPDLQMALETFVVMHEDLRARPAIRAVFDHLAKTLSRYIAQGLPDAGGQR